VRENAKEYLILLALVRLKIAQSMRSLSKSVIATTINMEENSNTEDNNTEEQEDVLGQIEESEEEKGPRFLLPFKLVLILIVLVVGLAGGWLFLQQERTIQIDKDLTSQVVTESLATPTPTSTPVPEPLSPQVKILETPTGYLNVRTEPSVIGGEVIGRVQPDQIYEYLEEKDDWYYIVLSQEEQGWVFGQYVEEIETTQPVNVQENPPASGEEISAAPENPKVRILQTPTGYLNVRNTSSVSGTRIGRVQPVEVYEYVDKENDWYQIIFGDDEKGWVSGEYIEEL